MDQCLLSLTMAVIVGWQIRVIPETKLISYKLQDGPIPMGVASGLTVYASAEWASLLPLADGGHQVVRGLTVPRVTRHARDRHD